MFASHLAAGAPPPHASAVTPAFDELKVGIASHLPRGRAWVDALTARPPCSHAARRPVCGFPHAAGQRSRGSRRLPGREPRRDPGARVPSREQHQYCGYRNPGLTEIYLSVLRTAIHNHVTGQVPTGAWCGRFPLRCAPSRHVRRGRRAGADARAFRTPCTRAALSRGVVAHACFAGATDLFVVGDSSGATQVLQTLLQQLPQLHID
jgi:hypothetical protein|eukprot:COSAG01_NODE_9620_length_2387_cov_1.356206_1_plen_207_part_00